MRPREQKGRTRREIGPEAENHAFVLRYRREPQGPSDAQPRIRIDLEYVNQNQRCKAANSKSQMLKYQINFKFQKSINSYLRET